MTVWARNVSHYSHFIFMPRILHIPRAQVRPPPHKTTYKNETCMYMDLRIVICIVHCLNEQYLLLETTQPIDSDKKKYFFFLNKKKKYFFSK